MIKAMYNFSLIPLIILYMRKLKIIDQSGRK